METEDLRGIGRVTAPNRSKGIPRFDTPSVEMIGRRISTPT